MLIREHLTALSFFLFYSTAVRVKTQRKCDFVRFEQKMAAEHEAARDRLVSEDNFPTCFVRQQGRISFSTNQRICLRFRSKPIRMREFETAAGIPVISIQKWGLKQSLRGVRISNFLD